jgi:cytochrome c-type protein NrfB
MNKRIYFSSIAFLATVLRIALAVLALSWVSSQAAAAGQTIDPENCIGCHEETPVLGVHSGTLFGATNRVATCADCHGWVTDLGQHETDGADMVRFDSAAAVLEPRTLTPLSLGVSTIATQNQTCLQCHSGKTLGALHWTHDAHGFELACSTCHQLHPKNDPVRGLSNASTIKLCVDCHSAQTRNGEGVRP